MASEFRRSDRASQRIIASPRERDPIEENVIRIVSDLAALYPTYALGIDP